MIPKNYGLIGYKENDNIGTFIDEFYTEEETENQIAYLQTTNTEYIKYQIIKADGTMPDFIQAINL